MHFKIIFLFLFLFTASSTTIDAQSEKRLVGKTFTPYQWEIYNTIYKRRYWDFRDNYDFIQFNDKNAFKRRYQGTGMRGTWTYNKKQKKIILSVTYPFKKEITLKIIKFSKKEIIYTSSEEDYKVKMFMKEGELPSSRKSNDKKPAKPKTTSPKKKN